MYILGQHFKHYIRMWSSCHAPRLICRYLHITKNIEYQSDELIYDYDYDDDN